MDPTKVLQIAFKTGLALTRRTLKRRTGDPKRHFGDGHQPKRAPRKRPSCLWDPTNGTQDTLARSKDQLAELQETPEEHQETPRSAIGHPKRLPNHSKRFPGGLQKLFWKDVSFIYADSVDHTKVFQIAIKTCLGPSQTAHKRPQKTLRRRPATQMSPQETPKLTLRDNKWHQRDTSAPQGSPRTVPKGPLESSKMPQERHWTPQKGSQMIPKGTPKAPPKASQNGTQN